MKILAVETSGETFSVALNEDGKTTASFYYDRGHIHSETIIPTVEKLLKDTKNTFKDIDKFALSAGPGSFTGIRIGMAVVKTFAQLLNKPVAAVDTLSNLEYFCVKIKGVKIVPAVDALRNEVYVKNYAKKSFKNNSKFNIEIKNITDFIKELREYKNKVLIVGNAAISYKEQLSKGLGAYSVSLPYIMHIPKAYVSAEIAYRAVKSVNYAQIKPLYIRHSWAEKNNKKK